MSNDLIKSIQSQLANIQTGVDDDTRAVAGGDFGKRISIRGGVFRKYASGKEVGTVEDRHMNVIFVKMAHSPSRTFYEGAYQEGAKVAPACWSSDSRIPDASVKTPQGKSCNECPQSVKGSGTGGQGTACRLSWRTAVVLPTDPAGDVMQLVLPATSVFGKEENGKWPFRAYIQMLAGHNISANRVITKMQFDTSAAVPTLQFAPVGAVPPEDVDTVIEQSKSMAAEKAVALTVFQQDESAAPVQPQTPTGGAEPVVRKEGPAAAGTAEPVADVIKKWAGKK